jgi:hypothetical protein
MITFALTLMLTHLLWLVHFVRFLTHLLSPVRPSILLTLPSFGKRDPLGFGLRTFRRRRKQVRGRRWRRWKKSVTGRRFIKFWIPRLIKLKLRMYAYFILFPFSFFSFFLTFHIFLFIEFLQTFPLFFLIYYEVGFGTASTGIEEC